MSIEENIFKRSTVNFDKLVDYGFERKNELYLYSINILNDTFRVEIEINNKGKVIGKIIELSFNEEYINFRVENITGEFVNKIREEFEKVLIDIKNKCFEEKNFISEQANRITNLIFEKYNHKPEFLWPKYPSDAIFRNSNNKWYCIIMNISRNKIDKGNDEIEIINVKLDTEKIIKLLSKKGFYKAYHMNKKNWISIILDDTLTDDEVFEYISESYSLTK